MQDVVASNPGQTTQKLLWQLQCSLMLPLLYQLVYIVAPVDKMAEVLRKTTKEAKDMISKVSIVNVDTSQSCSKRSSWIYFITHQHGKAVQSSVDSILVLAVPLPVVDDRRIRPGRLGSLLGVPLTALSLSVGWQPEYLCQYRWRFSSRTDGRRNSRNQLTRIHLKNGCG